MAIREVVDDHGRTWMIYAIIPGEYDDRIGVADGYTRGWLCFQSAAEKWRFLGIPDEWESLGEMELLALMDEAIRVPDRNQWGRTS